MKRKMVAVCLTTVSLLVFAALSCIKNNESGEPKHSASAATEDELSAGEIWDLVVEYHKARVAQHKARVQGDFFRLAAKLHDRGRLRAVLHFVIRQMADRFGIDSFETLTEQERDDLAAQMETAISAEIEKRDPTNQYPSWDEITARLYKQLGSKHSPIGKPGFYQEMSDLTGSRWVGYKRARILKDGPASFAQRDRLIHTAQTSLWIAAWAFYDDETGRYAAKALKAAKARGVDVRIMVDGQIAGQKFADEAAKDMAGSGIPVLFWQHPTKRFHGMHRKVMIVDGHTLLIGGMNFGNEYSHRAVKEAKHRWRDTDLILEGAVAQEAQFHFAERWNYIVEQGEFSVGKLDVPDRPEPATSEPRAMYIDHEPTQSKGDPILAATLKIIKSAQTKVDISNAYYIAVKPTEETLLGALERGVSIKMHTNSSDSVDVPTLIRPIYRGLVPLHAAGAIVLLQRGNTLHSKWLVADNQVGWIGSYNLHPRSLRYENEAVLLFDDKKLAGEFHSLFNADAAGAELVKDGQAISLPTAPLSDFGEAFFFDQL